MFGDVRRWLEAAAAEGRRRMYARGVFVRVEQAVYGSFPFWDRGYALLAHSAGCKPTWLEDFAITCQRYGERPARSPAVHATFALRMRGGPWMVVGVGETGSDDRGRPGALSFHGLFVTDRDYARLGAAPFPFEGLHKRDWKSEVKGLPSLATRLKPFPFPPAKGAVESDELIDGIVNALVRGEGVSQASEKPIDDLVRAAWLRLPMRVRRRRSVATWAFGNANGFDLVGVPARRIAQGVPPNVRAIAGATPNVSSPLTG